MMKIVRIVCLTLAILVPLTDNQASAQGPVEVEGQPLAANVRRLLQTLDYLGAPLPDEAQKAVQAACADRDAAKIQQLLDPHVLLAVHLNPEVRVKVARGPAKATLQM